MTLVKRKWEFRNDIVHLTLKISPKFKTTIVVEAYKCVLVPNKSLLQWPQKRNLENLSFVSMTINEYNMIKI